MKTSIANAIHYFLNILGYKVCKNAAEIISYPVEASPKDIKLIKAVKNITPNGKRDITNELSMCTVPAIWAAISAVRHVEENKIKGDIVECGVWRGGCALAMASILKEYGSKRKVYLFDTFAGMTDPTAQDMDGSIGAEQMKFVEKYNPFLYSDNDPRHTLLFIKKIFKEHGLSEYVEFVKGDVKTTLNPKCTRPSEIAVLRLDTDYYDSTRHELEFLYPRLAKMGVLMIDDYGAFQGTKLACDEFFKKQKFKPLAWTIDYTCRGYIKPTS